MRITTTVVFHNELEFMQGWYDSAKTYSDEIVMAAHYPTDGSLEWSKNLQSTSPIPIKILEFPEDTVFRHGFSYMKNACLEQATGDWVVSLDADEEMDITKAGLEPFLKNVLCISTVTMHVADPQPHWTLSNREQIKKEANWIRQRHWRIFKNIPSIRWHGLIHEELKVDREIHISRVARASLFKMWHFGCMANKNKRWFKEGLYAELLCRTYDNKELRHGTNPWWYTKYYEENKHTLRQQQTEYIKKRYERIN